MPTNVAVHTISFRGKAGAIFVLLCSSIVLYLISFVTHGWSFKDLTNPDGSKVQNADGSKIQNRLGLWESCQCSRNAYSNNGDWLIAVQAMLCIGLLGLLLAFLLIAIYMCVHTVSKNSTIIALVCVCFIAALFMMIGYIVYAVEMLGDKEKATLSWSFALSVISSILCLAAGILSVVQLRSAGVRM